MFHGLVAGGLACVLLASLIGIPPGRERPTFSAGEDTDTLCLLKRTTGIPCLTCGLTRSFFAIGGGDLGQAAAYHPLGPVLYAVFAVLVVRSAGIALRGRTWLGRTARLLLWSLPVLAVAMLGIWIVRLVQFFASGAGVEAWRHSALGRLMELLVQG